MEEEKLKEFNLSDKIIADNLYSEDVKEFIKKLKEGIHDFNEMETGDKGRNDFIDKLAGDKLI